ncbi:hypothetical protein Tco_0986457 [Tanacetum coccineum]
MLAQEEIDKLVDGDEDEESYASAFVDTVINNDDDIRSKLEPGSYKEHPEHVSDDDEKKRKDEEVEKEKEVVEIVKDTNIDDTSSAKKKEVVTKKEVVNMSSSQEIRKEYKKTPIPSPIRYPRNYLSLDKTISEELADTITPTTATSSKIPSTTTRQKKSLEDEFHSHHDEHQDDDAPPEGEKINVDKRVPTIFDHARIEAKLRDSLGIQMNQDLCINEDYSLLKYRNTKEKKYILSLHKIHAEEFLEPDFEEKLNRWVRKEFKTLNEDAWITEVVRIITDQPHGLDFMEQFWDCRATR